MAKAKKTGNDRDWFDVNDQPAPPATPAPEFTPDAPALLGVPVEPIASAPVADVPRGTSDEKPAEPVTESTDDAAPYGRDAGGRALAPYGYRADGVTPARKRGRKGADPTPTAVPDGPRDDKPADKPAKKKQSAIDKIAAEFDAAVKGGDGYWSVEADAARCERARRNAPDFQDLAELAIESGEGFALGFVHQALLRQNPSDKARIDRAMAAVKPMREIRFKFRGTETTVLSSNAESVAFILAYFLPWKPSHPLLRAAIQFAFAQRAYLKSVEASVNAALAAPELPAPAATQNIGG